MRTGYHFHFHYFEYEMNYEMKQNYEPFKYNTSAKPQMYQVYSNVFLKG